MPAQLTIYASTLFIRDVGALSGHIPAYVINTSPTQAVGVPNNCVLGVAVVGDGGLEDGVDLVQRSRSRGRGLSSSGQNGSHKLVLGGGVQRKMLIVAKVRI